VTGFEPATSSSRMRIVAGAQRCPMWAHPERAAVTSGRVLSADGQRRAVCCSSVARLPAAARQLNVCGRLAQPPPSRRPRPRREPSTGSAVITDTSVDFGRGRQDLNLRPLDPSVGFSASDTTRHLLAAVFRLAARSRPPVDRRVAVRLCCQRNQTIKY